MCCVMSVCCAPVWIITKTPLSKARNIMRADTHTTHTYTHTQLRVLSLSPLWELGKVTYEVDRGGG